MRRHVIHVVTALLGCAVGFLTTDGYKNLAYALPLALLAFCLTKALPRIDLDLHFLIVVVISLLSWAAGLTVFFSALSWEHGSCVIGLAPGDEKGTPESGGAARLSLASTPPAEIPDYSRGGIEVPTARVNSFWAGVVDKKVTAKPAPRYPPIAKAARAEGTVAVWVLVDESGRVVRSQPISGHPLLKQAAAEAACRARFSPIPVDGPPLRVSAILTYKFML